MHMPPPAHSRTRCPDPVRAGQAWRGRRDSNPLCAPVPSPSSSPPYYVGPGHTPEIFPDTEIVEFSPTAELNETMEVVTKNMEGTGS